MQRSLATFPLPSGLIGKLKSAGFQVCEDLRDLGVVELSKELNIARSEAAEILKLVSGNFQTASSTANGRGQGSPTSSTRAVTSHGTPYGSSEGRSALEILREEQLQSYIVTFSAQVDGMLGGGVALGKITEICGAPGVGKTQFSMQLAVDVRIPEMFGGVEGEAVFIDTEGSFVVERMVDIAQSAIQHLKGVAESSSDQGMLESSNQFTLVSILAGMHYFRCHDYVELVALVNLLPEFVSSHSKVRLIVVDSIASPFRHGFEDMGLRNRLLSGMAQNFIRLATNFRLAVVLTNQMTTRVNREDNKSTQLVPALGESWGHACTNRVILFWRGRERQAMLYKSPNRKESTVPYQVTADGIRDVVTQSPGQSEDHVTTDLPLSQLVSLSSSQMDDLEMSPCYDIDDEVVDLPEFGQESDSSKGDNIAGFARSSNKKTKQYDYLETETNVTPANAAILGHDNQSRVGDDRAVTTCYSQRRSQNVGSRKRPHPET